MKEIVIISGKGGAGKTSFCASLIHTARNAVFCDLDVDLPDLHIIAEPIIKQKEIFRSGNTAVIRSDKCIHCGRCRNVCRFEAVTPEINISSEFCEGCGVCVQLCPAQAIDFPEKECGEYFISETRFGTFVHACLYPGQENSGRLVNLLKEKSREIARSEQADYIIYDGSPGIGCPVISSLSGVHLAVAVVEATPSGQNDFERVASLCRHFNIPVAMIINKYDIEPNITFSLEEWARKNAYPVLGKIPFTLDIARAMVQRKAITEIDSPFVPLFHDISERILQYANSPTYHSSSLTLKNFME